MRDADLEWLRLARNNLASMILYRELGECAFGNVRGCTCQEAVASVHLYRSLWTID